MLVKLRNLLQLALAALRNAFFRHLWGMDIGKGARISGKAALDFAHPRGVHIGAFTLIAPGARIFTHEFVRSNHYDTRIGQCCFVGANAMILPGITIGDHCVIGAGAVVTQDVPAHSLVAGNPARIIRSDISTGRYGRLPKGPPVPEAMLAALQSSQVSDNTGELP